MPSSDSLRDVLSMAGFAFCCAKSPGLCCAARALRRAKKAPSSAWNAVETRRQLASTALLAPPPASVRYSNQLTPNSQSD